MDSEHDVFSCKGIISLNECARIILHTNNIAKTCFYGIILEALEWGNKHE